MAKMIMIDAMVIARTLHLYLHRGRVICLSCEVAMVDPIRLPEQMNEELIITAQHSASGHA
jgi:hypothetical protein